MLTGCYQPIIETVNRTGDRNKYVYHSRDPKCFHHWICGNKDMCA